MIDEIKNLLFSTGNSSGVVLIGENHDMYQDLGISRVEEIDFMIKEGMLETADNYFYENNLMSGEQNEKGFLLNASDSIQHSRVQLCSVGLEVEKMLLRDTLKLGELYFDLLSDMNQILQSIKTGFVDTIGNRYHLMQADEERIKSTSPGIFEKLDGLFKGVTKDNYEVTLINIVDNLVKLDGAIHGKPLENDFATALKEANLIRDTKMVAACNQLATDGKKAVIKLGQHHVDSFKNNFTLDSSITVINHNDWCKKLIPDSFKRNMKSRKPVIRSKNIRKI